MKNEVSVRKAFVMNTYRLLPFVSLSHNVSSSCECNGVVIVNSQKARTVTRRSSYTNDMRKN